MSFLTTSYLGWVPESRRGFRMGSPITVSALTLLLQQQQTKPFRGFVSVVPASLLSPPFISVFFDPHNSSESGGPLYSPCYRWRSWSSQRRSDLLKSKLLSVRTGTVIFPAIFVEIQTAQHGACLHDSEFYNSKDIIWKWVIFLFPEPFHICLQMVMSANRQAHVSPLRFSALLILDFDHNQEWKTMCIKYTSAVYIVWERRIFGNSF